MKKQMPEKLPKKRSVGKGKKQHPEKKISHSEKILELAVTGQSIENSFSGPVPSPEILEKYEKTLPGLANRLIKMAEKEQDLNNAHISHSLGNETKKIYATTIVTIAITAVAALAILYNYSLEAVIIIVSLSLSKLFKDIFGKLFAKSP